MISDPRVMRGEIAHAYICDKISLVGSEPANLAIAAKTLNQPTKWSGGLDFLRAGSMAKFPHEIQTKGYFLCLGLFKKRTPILRPRKKTAARQIG